MFKMVGIALLCLVSVVVLFYGARFIFLLHVSKGLVQSALPYQKNDVNESKEGGFSMLVIGDSTAAGVGAMSSEESVPGRVAASLGAAYVENHAVSGAQVKDLSAQIAKSERFSYDLILVQIGANDITHFHSPTKTAAELSSILKSLPQSKQVIVISAGDVGTATMIPFFLRPLFTKETLAYHAAFAESLQRDGITYVNLYNAPRNDLFKTDPKTYLAADSFHPSSAGYDIWFESIEKQLVK